jgi:nucleoid-associated protein YgaU
MPSLSPVPAALALLLALTLPALATDLEQEYIQVRKIALKDPRVQAAFEKASERLDAKILQIDPALKPVVERQHTSLTQPAPIARRPSSPVASPSHDTQYIIVKGDTLSSIATRYNVTVPALQRANHITDAKKLRVGQKLLIPGVTTPPPVQTQEEKPAETKTDQLGDWLNDIKKDL